MAAQKRVGSRLIKQERKKMMRQIFIFGGLALLLIFIFIFVVLPLFIRTINSILDTNPIADNNQQVILQAPVLSAPVSATNSAQLTVSGVDAAEHQVVIVLNGQEDAQVDTEDDGTFEAEVELTEGENSITAFAQDEDDNQSPVGQTYTVDLDTEDPELEVTEPEDGEEITTREALATVSGNTDPSARVFINDRMLFPSSDGSFRTNVNLSDGENELTIRAVDEAGNETATTVTVRYNR